MTTNTNPRLPALSRRQLLAALFLVVAAAATAIGLVSTSGSKAGGLRDVATALHKGCDDPTALYTPGMQLDGLPLVATNRVCSDATPRKTLSSGNLIDPVSEVRSNFTSFIYGDCDATPRNGNEGGCAPPMEVQVWPACERNPSKFAAKTASSSSDIGPDQLDPGPQSVIATGANGLRTYLYSDETTEDAAPSRAETIIGDSDVVVFSNESVGSAASQRDRLMSAVNGLVPSGTSNSPAVPAPSTASALARASLPAAAKGAVDGTLTCNAR